MPPRPDESTEPDAGDAPARVDVFRETGDVQTRLPLGAINPAPWNPKRKISGRYRKGLSESLKHFGIRDALKVWADPKKPGQFVAADGNQRLDLMYEEACKSLGIDDLPEDDEAGRAAIRSRASSIEVDVRILADLSPEDIRLLTASFDRNHAVYDENKLADLMASLTSTPAALIKSLVRPEVAFNPPPSAPKPETAPTFVNPDLASGNPPTFVPTEDEPWGPPPPEEGPGAVEAAGYPVNAPAPRRQLVPVMFSLTPAGHARLTEGILKSKARVVREPRLIAAVEALAAADDSVDLDDLVVELALTIANDRLAILKADDT